MRRIYLAIVFVIFAVGIFAQDREGAAQFAQEFINHTDVFNMSALRKSVAGKGVSNTPQPNADLRTAYQTAAPKRTPLFVFQPADSEGFIMVAQTGDNYAVVGYSGKGSFDAGNIPLQLRAMMNFYEDSLLVTPALSKLSVEMTANNTGLRSGNAGATPLLDQKSIALNQFHHEEVDGAWTGCVATAVEQIMAYYKFPNQGMGSYCYTLAPYGEICADFGNTTYNWNNPTEEDYKKLGFQIGVALDMQYGGPNGSITNLYDNRIREHFGYSVDKIPEYLYHDDDDILMAIIDDGMPLYATVGGNPVGHAVVLDGYDSRGWLHYNFGWGGDYNGYYIGGQLVYITSGAYFFGIDNITLMTPPTLQSVSAEDSQALKDLYNSFNGALDWDLSQPAASWNGVLAWGGRARVLDISTDFGNLPHLEGCCTVAADTLDFTVPESFGNLTALKYARIEVDERASGNNYIYLPQSLGQCAGLVYLFVTNCTGQIPASIGQCANLTSLYLTFGKLTGEIPASIGNLTNLKSLNLSYNQLSGIIPSTLANLTNLGYLGLHHNQFSGAIPNFVVTKTQDLSYNQFSGTIPLALFENNSVRFINLSNNRLSGAVPEAIGNLTNLQSIDLSNNQLTSLPESMSGLEELSFVNLHHNLLAALPSMVLHPMFPDSRVSFDASYNLIASLPDFYFNEWEALEAVDLSHNRLTEIPKGLLVIDDLSINLSNNQIEKFPSNIDALSQNLTGLWLNDNEIQDDIPVSLLKHIKIAENEGNQLMAGGLRLENNFFTFENIPQIDIAYNRVNFQNPIPLKKTVYKVQIGDTLRINIKEIAPFSRPDNVFHWGVWHDMAYSVEYFAKYVSGIGWRPFPEPTDSILTIVVDEETLKNRYFCYVTNPDLPLREYFETGAIDDGSWLFEGGEQNYAYKPFLFTDTIKLELGTEAEAFADQNLGAHTLLSKNIGSDGMSDHTVTLVTPAGARGAMQWQASTDGQTWMDVSSAMSDAEIKANVQSVTQRELKLFPQTTAFYRCRITDEGCDPIYSDTIKINAYGKIIFDQTVSVTGDTQTTLTAEDISVTVPAGFHEGDFHLTIIKLDHPPLAKEQPAGEIGAVYDISVDFGTQFDEPLYIRLKNINTDNFSPEKMDNYRAVYFDDAQGKWVEFDDMRFSLADRSLCFATHHLTKVSWYDLKGIGYDSYYEQDGITVYFNELDFFNSDTPYAQTPQSWHNSIDAPKLVMDAAHYLKEVMNKINADSHIDSRDKFTIYVKPMGEAEGEVNLMGTFGDYMIINSKLKNPEQLCKTIAHEFMHYIQDDFMLFVINDFWMEAHATLADRVVWDASFIAQAESEQWLQTGLNGQIFDNLALPWDYFDGNKPSDYGGRTSYYLAGCFMSYMQQYRTGTKLEPLKLLSQTFTQWRRHLSDYIVTNLNSTIGDEYENFVKYLLSGENAKFKALTSFNSLQYVMAAKVNSSVKANGDKLGFATVKNYSMSLEDKPVEETLSLSVPYLSSRVVVFNNKSKDALTVIQLERLHESDPNYKVYFAKFDETSKTFKYTDISDSTKYSFVLDVVKQGEGLKQKYISFLLLINKDADQPIFDFAASYEITATPVMNANYFATIALSGTTLTWAGGEEFATGSTIDNLSITKQLKDESTLLVDANYTYVFSAGDIVFNGMIVKRTVEIAQQLEYNYVLGEFNISQTRTDSDIEDYYDLITDEDGHYQPVFSHSVVKSAVTTEGTIHLKGVTDFVPIQSDGLGGINPNYVVYISPSAAAARDNIVSATDNGAAVDVSGVTQLVLVLKIKN